MTLCPGTRVEILPARLRSGTVTAIHKCGILVILDDGGHRYYDRSWLATEQKESTETWTI